MQTARAEADAFAWELHPKPEQLDGRIAAFNDALVRWAIAKAMVDPGDITKPFFPSSESTVREAFTSEGARWVYLQLERLHIEMSPIMPQIDDQQAISLGILLSTKKWTAKKGKDAIVRRYLAAAWELIEHDE